MEAQIRVMCFEDEGRGPKTRKAGSLLMLRETKEQIFL